MIDDACNNALPITTAHVSPAPPPSPPSPPAEQALDAKSGPDWIAAYAERGWASVLVPKGRKGVVEIGWQTPEPADDVAAAWREGSNLGLLVGEPSGDLVDVDLDHARAIELADAFLPQTALVSGRAGAMASHRWYVSSEAGNATYDLKPHGKLVERHGKGRQTLVAPSIHPDTGEAYEWHQFGDPSVVEAEALATIVLHLATATALSLSWPAEGSRQPMALAAAGFLCRAGADLEDAARIVGAAARGAGDEEWRKREQAVRDTYDTINAGGEATGFTTLMETSPELAAQMRKWWRASSPSSPSQQAEASALREIVESVEVFRAEDDDLYAMVPERERYNAVRVRAGDKGGFRAWLSAEYAQQTQTVARPGKLDDAVSWLLAINYGSVTIPFRTRLDSWEDRLVLDLGDAAGRAVVVVPGSWEVVAKPPIPMRRPGSQRALPVPVAGGSLEILLGQVLHTGTQSNLRLCVAWLIAALSPTGPYPLLSVTGEEGSAKSSMTRAMRNLIDPVVPPIRSRPSKEEDLVIAARGNHVLAFDNLNDLPEWLSAALCKLSTGSGFGTRKLYTNDEEVLFYGSNPVIINGIGDLATAGDLLSRTLLVDLPSIPSGQRVTEARLRDQYATLHPQILGAALDAIAAGLLRLPEISIPELPRLADVAQFVTACEPALGWPDGTFLNLLRENTASKTSGTVDASPVASAVIAFAEGMTGDTHSEGATAFLRTLSGTTPDSITIRKEWPKQANGLTKELNRIAGTLRTSHRINVQCHRTRHGSMVTITKLRDDDCDDGAMERDGAIPQPPVDRDDVTMVTIGDAETVTDNPPAFSGVGGAPASSASSEAAQQVTAEPSSPSSHRHNVSADCVWCEIGDIPLEGAHQGEPCPRFPHMSLGSEIEPASGDDASDADDADTGAGAER